MFVARFSIIFCFLSIAASVFAGSFSNKDINELGKKITERRQKVTFIDARYALSAADSWLSIAKVEYSDRGSASLAEIAWQQTNDILKIVDENKLPLKSVETANGYLRVKNELWAVADETKKNTRYNIVVEDVARLEVQLAWAGLKTWESGWKSASTIVNDAQKKADDIKKVLTAPEKPIVQPVIQPTQQPIQPSAIITKQPVSMVVPADITFELTGRSGTPAFPGTALIIGDNADKFRISNNAPAKFPLGTTSVTWKAVDHNGKTLTAVQKVTIVDTTPPTIIIPSDINIELTSPDGMEVNPGNAMAIDIGDPNPKITNNAPKFFMPGITIITWTAKDNSGNIATAGQKVIVADSIPPVIKAPDDIIVEATDPEGTIINIGPAKATDNLDPMPVVTTDAPEKFTLGVTMVHWTATDKFGNKSRVSQRVTVADTTKPEITLPGDIIADAVNADGAEVNIGTAKVRDNADATAVVSNDAPAVFPLGETIITWTVKDASGNINTAKQKVSITDKTPPVISSPADITIEAQSSNGTVVNLGSPTATDNIDKQPVIKNDAPPSFKPGSYIITWTAIDKSGNESKAIQKVTITDNNPPRLLPPADINIEAASLAKVKVNIGTPEITDNADSSPKVANDAPLLFPFGTTVVTWLAIDSSGNRSMATQRVKIIDTIPPTIIPPKDIRINEASTQGIAVLLGKPTINDIVDPNPQLTNNAPQLFKPGETEVIWKVVDFSGNSSVAVQKVIVVKKGQKIIPTNKAKILPPKVTVKDHSQLVFLPYSIHFAPNAVSLSEKSISILKSMLPALKNNLDIKIIIVGCADSSGALDKNIEIATERSYVVADYLVKNGISVDRLLVDSKIVQTDNSSAAGSKARETRFFYNSPTVKIKAVDQTADVVIVDKKEVIKPVKKKKVKESVKNIVKPAVKNTAKPAAKNIIKPSKKTTPVTEKNDNKKTINTNKSNTIKNRKNNKNKKQIKSFA